MKFINKKLRSARKIKKISADDLAFLLRGRKKSVTSQTVLRWERGEQCPDVRYFAEICSLLNEKPENFFSN